MKPLHVLLLLEHMEHWIPENPDSKKKYGVTLAVSQRVPCLNFLFQSAADIGFLQPSRTGSESLLFTSRLEAAHRYNPRSDRPQRGPN